MPSGCQIQCCIITDEEKIEYFSELKGFYDYTDVNRVVSAFKYLSDKYLKEGYYIPIHSTNSWSMIDIFNRNHEYETYIDDLRRIRNAIYVMVNTPQLPEGNLDYKKANDIEQILMDVDFLLDNLSSNLYYSDEIYAGEVQ